MSEPEFYASLAADYDRMTRFGERLAREREQVRAWIERFGWRSALDAACGTGMYAILLAEAGVATTGADLSPEMLAQARRHATEQGVEVEWRELALQDLAANNPGPFDAVLCLGNSLPHLLSTADLAAALSGFAAALRPGGQLLLQLLNYQRVLEHRERIVGVHRQGELEFVRFYDFLEHYVRFNVLRIHHRGEAPSWDLAQTVLHPYVWADVAVALEGAGFVHLRACGDLGLAPYEPDSSPNLVVLAERG